MGGWEDEVKRGELQDPIARFIVVRKREDGALAGYLHYRFLEEDQLEGTVECIYWCASFFCCQILPQAVFLFLFFFF
jgi:hypothetical protein